MERDGLAGRGTLFAMRTAIADGLYRGFRVVMRAAIALHFRRVTVVGLGLFPARGAVLIAANHPSTWSDVLLLEALLGRRLHFLAGVRQFRPRLRAVLLRVFGTLPVYVSESGLSTLKNEATFRRCRGLFDRGEVVAVFPEGTSKTDRSLMPLKRGAARLALSYRLPQLAGRSFCLVPIALRYADRTAFRADVVMTIGEPITISELRKSYPCEGEMEVERLTGRIADALRSLGAMADDPEDEPLLATLESIAAARARAGDSDPTVEMLASASALRREDPERFARLRRLAHAHARARNALRVSDEGLRKPAPRSGWSSVFRVAVLAVAAIPALAGAVIHAIPVLLARFAIRQYGYESSQISFARISAGFFFLTSYYALLAFVLVRFVDVHPWTAGVILAAAAIVGVLALACGDQLRPVVERWRLAWIARRHPGLVRRARASEAELGRWVAERWPAEWSAS